MEMVTINTRAGETALAEESKQDESGKHDDLVRQARGVQENIDELKAAIRQGHQQQLKPEYIEEMSTLLAKLLKELDDLFK